MFMADMFDLSDCEGSVSVLDPGAGTGILSIAFLERLMSLSSDINASLTCYETDPEVLPVLKSNLEYAKSEYPGRIEYRVLEEDYILSQSNDFVGKILLANEDPLKYDYIIANPPLFKGHERSSGGNVNAEGCAWRTKPIFSVCCHVFV
jgi:hypothetical protein